MPNDNDDDVVRRIGRGLLAFVPMVGWLAFVFVAGLAEHDATTAPDFPEQLRLVGVASGTALATIAGAFLGVDPQTGTRLDRLRRPALSISGWATVLYFFGLVAAIVIWAVDDQRAYSAEVIQTSLATLFGFGIGALKAQTDPVG